MARRPDPLTVTLAVVALLTAVRLLVLFTTPLELYPDEAQYWSWSRGLSLGYYSKPPMIAWLIAGTTAVGGDGEPWVRVSALWLHALAALALFFAGRRLYGPLEGLVAALLYSLMPGVQLSSGVISTDAPLLAFLALTLAAYAGLFTAERSRQAIWAALLGAALGLAFLSKYAAIYFPIGLALGAATCREARQVWRPGTVAITALGFALLAAPNLLWNAANGFTTLSHTAANAHWEAGNLFNPTELVEFLSAQLGVFGPIPFLVLVGGAAALSFRRRLQGRDMALLWLAATPLLVVSVQAFVSRAHANWAAAAYVPASVLVGAWLVRWKARRTLIAAVTIQAAVAAVFLGAAASPAFADRLGLSNSFKRARGWSTAAAAIQARAEAEADLSALVVDHRFLFHTLTYYGRDYFRRDGAPPLRIWQREAQPKSQPETVAALTASEGRRVLTASMIPEYPAEIRRDFRASGPATTVSVRLDPERTRDLVLFVGEGFAPLPRDPVTGQPPSAPPPSPTTR